MNINRVLMCTAVVGSYSVITGGFASIINNNLLSPRIIEAKKIYEFCFANARNHFPLNPLNLQLLLDWNDGALRKAVEAYKLEINKPFDFPQIGRFAAVSAGCSISGHLFGVATEGIYRKIYQIPDSYETHIAANIGAIAAGAFTFYATNSLGLSLFNAAVCTIINPHNKKF